MNARDLVLARRQPIQATFAEGVVREENEILESVRKCRRTHEKRREEDRKEEVDRNQVRRETSCIILRPVAQDLSDDRDGERHVRQRDHRVHASSGSLEAVLIELVREEDRNRCSENLSYPTIDSDVDRSTFARKHPATLRDLTRESVHAEILTTEVVRPVQDEDGKRGGEGVAS